MTDEQKGAQTNAPTETAKDIAGGNQSEAASIFEGIRGEREKLEKTRDEIKTILAENQTVLARMALSGRSIAGQVPPKELTIEEKAQQMADATLRRLGVKK